MPMILGIVIPLTFWLMMICELLWITIRLPYDMIRHIIIMYKNISIRKQKDIMEQLQKVT